MMRPVRPIPVIEWMNAFELMMDNCHFDEWINVIHLSIIDILLQVTH